MTGDGGCASPSVSVIVLAYGLEPYLAQCVTSILASITPAGDPIDLELLLVDNGAPQAVGAVARDPRLTVLRAERNLGFAGGCNLGAAVSSGRQLVFVNSDAFLAPDAIHALTGALAPADVGLVSGSIRLADRPELMNTAGNPMHFLGVVWAGSFGEPVRDHQCRTDVASVSGAFFAADRATWDELGGFDDCYFAYHEDTDLSLRAWECGYRVRYEPTAIAWHHYAFSRNPTKQYLLERNRWITVLTNYPRRVLLSILPALLALEIVVCLTAARQGWLRDKLRSYWWLLVHWRYLRDKRSRVQSQNLVSAARFSSLLTARLEPAALEQPAGLGLLNAMLAGYWSASRRLARLNAGPSLYSQQR